MAIVLVYSTSGITSDKKFVATSKWQSFWKFWNITHLHFDFRYEKIVPNYAKKVFFMVMTSSMTQGGLKIGLLFSFINEIRIFLVLTKKTNWDIIIKIPVYRYQGIMTIFIWIRIHVVIDDVSRSQSMSNFEITVSPSIFQLELRSKAESIGHAHGYLFGIFNFRYWFRYKSFSRPQNGNHCENFETLYKALIDLSYEEIVPNYAPKVYFMVMTSPDDLKVALYIYV